MREREDKAAREESSQAYKASKYLALAREDGMDPESLLPSRRLRKDINSLS